MDERLEARADRLLVVRPMMPEINRIYQGDCLETMRLWPSGFVNCAVTSPPYWGLRDYGVEGQIGLESTPDEFVAKMVDVFREVRRVLRDDGTLWLNLGDSYVTRANAGHGSDSSTLTKPKDGRKRRAHHANAPGLGGHRKFPSPKNKDLVCIPWMVAFALRADGWYLRQDIIWSKPNPMPESVTDRCTKAHEYLFLLAKSERYYFDQSSIAEPSASTWDPENCKAPDGWATHDGGHGSFHKNGREKGRSGNKARKPASARGVPVDTHGKSNGAVAGSIPWEGLTRNKRSVWTVTTKPFSGEHFATFPPDLITPCILAGSPQGGVVLDPFMGAGTTALVSAKYARSYIGCELNPDYIKIAERRVAAETAQGKFL